MISRYSGIPLIATRQCIAYIFSSKCTLALFCGFALAMLMAFLYGVGILSVSSDKGKVRVCIEARPAKWGFPWELAWLLAGPAVTFGTIFASQAFSRLRYPITLERYLYPYMILTWLAFGVCISKCKAKTAYALILAAMLLVASFPSYVNTIKQEKEIGRLQEKTLDEIGSLGTDDYIVMDNTANSQYKVILRYYFPQTDFAYPDDEYSIPPFREDKENWLLTGSEVTKIQIEEAKRRGYVLEQVAANGDIGGYSCWVYQVLEE